MLLLVSSTSAAGNHLVSAAACIFPVTAGNVVAAEVEVPSDMHFLPVVGADTAIVAVVAIVDASVAVAAIVAVSVAAVIAGVVAVGVSTLTSLSVSVLSMLLVYLA